MSNQIINNYNSSAAVGILTAAFVVLKVLGFIDWSWWLVFLPMYIGLAIILGIFAVAICSAAILGVVYAILKFTENYRIKRALKLRRNKKN
jgi:hypothetical protein